VKPNHEKYETKLITPPAPDTKPPKYYIESEGIQQHQQLKKLPNESLPNKRPPNTQEYDISLSYSQRPVQKNTNQIYEGTFLLNKMSFLPYIKLRDSSFANTFIPVLPSSLTELK
jgi:hypothetical protein